MWNAVLRGERAVPLPWSELWVSAQVSAREAFVFTAWLHPFLVTGMMWEPELQLSLR